MPGTFYRRPDPESDPYFEEGDQVSAGDTVGLIEVMKSFHEVKAEEEGTIARYSRRERGGRGRGPGSPRDGIGCHDTPP